ncbi:FtsW/RodA/SpoVE family cell cycle protein [Eupransor demetentiae]|uniref:Probable peptidoglycan glycosyltransferase FtsW n=1 Tax=Eupransor demetentiae TaxID=3109584 RepID=A0ABM9N3C6_9LACO|nr:Peptodoglycan polymerase FtsW/RodA/SpoVE (FtsW) [Lactobacillaceae bacterium LMG 33000]
MLKKLQKLDYWIAVPYAALSALGVVMVFSASQNAYTSPVASFLKQLLFVVVGWLTAFFFFHISVKALKNPRNLQKFMWITAGLLLIARFMPAVNGAHGWIRLGSFMTFQPVEMAKLVLILYFADLLTRYPWYSELPFSRQIRNWRNRWTLLFIPAVILALYLAMPDLGNLFITLVILIVLWMASGVSSRWTFFWVILGALALMFLPELIRMLHLGESSSYAIRRLTNFVNPWQNMDQSRQLLYSYYAIARGGFFGAGLGNSIIKPFLPESNTDFIMAVATEELGALVVSMVLISLLILIGRLLYLGIKEKSQYYRLLLFGIAALLLMQAFVNLGGVVGLLPITGVVFPFISGGGSSFIVFSVAIGLALNISAKSRKQVVINPGDTLARKDLR